MPEGSVGGSLRCARCHAVFPNFVSGPLKDSPTTWYRLTHSLSRYTPTRKTLRISGATVAGVLAIALLVWVLLPAGPSKKILGSWQRTLSDGTTPLLYFTSDGNVVASCMGQRVQGRYHFVDRDWVDIQLSCPFLPGNAFGKMRVEFPRKGVMILTNERGMRTEWQSAD